MISPTRARVKVIYTIYIVIHMLTHEVNLCSLVPIPTQPVATLTLPQVKSILLEWVQVTLKIPGQSLDTIIH